MDDALAGAFRIGDRVVQPARGRIVSVAGEVHVEPRAMDVLVALARRAGDTVARDELIQAVWKHPHVSDEALSRCISLLRRALGDVHANARVVETIPKRGYRLALPVEPVRPDGKANGLAAGAPDGSMTNVALQPTRLIDRETELAEVCALLDEGRLVTLTGSAGVGKTRLALEIGSRRVADFGHGVWLVELAPLSDAALVAAKVAAVLGIELGPVARPLLELARRLAERDVLLILDNCEHLVDAVAALTEAILGAAPRVRMLATSQVLIGIGGEQAYPVPPLRVPADDDDHAGVLATASVQLFAERARAADPHFRVDGEGVHPVSAICRRLEGIPLAIEMAAARAPALGVQTLARLLDERFRILTAGRRTAPARQQTLRATLDWSFGLLAESERTVLNRLAIFAGGFTLDAATTVAADEHIDAIDVVDLIARLVARSLVVVETNATGKRYRLLETTRAYAQERLAESQQSDTVRALHLDCFLALAEEANPHLRGSDQAMWMARLDLERENFLVAYASCDQVQRGGDLGLRLTVALKFYWIHRGGMELGYRLAVEALARPGAQQRTLVRSRALGTAGQLASCMGRDAEVVSYQDEALSIARDVGDVEQIAIMLLGTGTQAYVQGRLKDARVNIVEALALVRQRRHTIAFKSALQLLADLERHEGHLDAAEELYEEALALAREMRAMQDTTIALLNLASVSIARGNGQRPPPILLEALNVVEAIGSKPLGANVLLIAAGLAAHLRAWRQAALLFGAGDAQCQQIGFQREPADEAFLAPLIARSREALGATAFRNAEAVGRSLAYDAALAEARRWLEMPGRVRQEGNVVEFRRR